MIAEDKEGTEKYAIFVDNSGSTGGCRNYWDTVNYLINLYAKDI